MLTRMTQKGSCINFNCGLGMIIGANVVEKAKKLGLGVELELINFGKPVPLPRMS